MEKKGFFILALFIIILSIETVLAPFGYDNPNLPRLENPNAFIGNFTWNGVCLEGGVEIRNDGTICAQKLDVFNITSINITRQNVTILENFISLGNITAPWFLGLIKWENVSGLNTTIDSLILINNDSVNNYILDNNNSVNNYILDNNNSVNNNINSQNTSQTNRMDDEFVPYSGAGKNTDVGLFNITADYFFGNGSSLIDIVHPIINGTTDGQMAFWNDTRGKWVYTDNITWDGENMSVDGDLDLIATSTNRILLPTSTTQTDPTLAWNNGEDGFGIFTPGRQFMFIQNRVQLMSIDTDGITGEEQTGRGFFIKNGAIYSSTVPTYSFRGDINTGVGRATADQLSLTAGAVEGVRVTESGGVVQTQFNGSTNHKDNVKAYFGTSDDVSIGYDGFFWNFTQEVGAGLWNFNTNAGIINFISNLFINGNVNITGDLNQTNGNATINMVYAEMWFHDDTTSNTTVISTQNVWENVSGFEGGDQNGQKLNGFSYAGANTGTLTAQVNGLYKVTFSMSFGNSGNNQEYQVSIAKNNIVQNQTDTHRKIGSAGDVGNIGSSGFINLVVGDIINLQIKNNDATADVLTHAVNVNLVRIGN